MSSEPEQSGARPPVWGAAPAGTGTARSSEWGPAQEKLPVMGATAWGPSQQGVAAPAPEDRSGTGGVAPTIPTSNPAGPVDADAGALAPRAAAPVIGRHVAAPADAPFPDPSTAVRPEEPPLSARTGEPRRNLVVTLAATLLCLGAAFYAVELVVTFWQIVHRALEATMLIRQVHPTEASLPLVLSATLAILHLAATAALASFAGFHAWNGDPYARWAGLAAVVLAALTFEVGTTPLLGLMALIPGALLLFLPAAVRYNRQQRDFRYLRAHLTAPEPLPEQVYYGPLPRYIDPER